MSSMHFVRVGQGLAVFAVAMGGSCLDNFSLLYRFRSLHLSPGNGSIKTKLPPQAQRTVKPKQLINTTLSASASTWAYVHACFD